MAKRMVTVAYEAPRRASNSFGLYKDKVTGKLEKFGLPQTDAVALVAKSHTYIEGAFRGNLSPETTAAVIWHQHCSGGLVVPEKKDCGAHECPSEAGESGAACPGPGANPKPTAWTKSNTRLTTWFERDRAHVELTDLKGRSIVEWWDEAVAEAVEDGFLKSRDLHGSAVEYANHIGARVDQKTTRIPRGHEATEANDSAPACTPFTRVERDPHAFAACQALQKKLGYLDNDRKLYEFCRQQMSREPVEVFYVLSLDLHQNIKGFTEVARGQTKSVSVDVSDVLRAAIAHVGEGFVVCHNHPSGKAYPSPKDEKLTEAIRQGAKAANLLFLDHLVIGTGEYYSFTDGKLKRA